MKPIIYYSIGALTTIFIISFIAWCDVFFLREPQFKFEKKGFLYYFYICTWEFGFFILGLIAGGLIFN